MSARRLHAYLLLIFVSLIWGIASSVIKFTQQGIPTLPFLSYRFAISTAIALAFFIFTKHKLPKNLGDIIRLTWYGLLVSSVSLGLLFWGLEHTTVLEEGLIAATAPLIISYMGVKFLHEHVTKREKIGLLIALVGTVITIFEPFVPNNGKAIHIFGNLLILAYVVVNAYATVIAKKLLQKGISPATLTNFGFIVGFISVLVFTIYQVGIPSLLDSVATLEPQYHLGVLYMALISGTLAFTLLNKGNKMIEIGEASIFSYLIPIFAAPVAVLWLGEKITLNLIIGAVVIAAGILVAEIKTRKT